MVDASAALPRARQELAPGHALRSAQEPSVTILAAAEAGLRTYAAFCESARFAPPQSPLWVSSWIAAMAPDAVFAFLEREGGASLALALEIEPLGPFRAARFIGGRHANGNHAPTKGAGPSRVSRADLVALVRELRHSRRDIDALILERQLPTLDGAPNPLLQLASGQSPNPAFAVSLEGGFAALLERASGKRKRKKHRSQLRKFEAAGGYRHIEASTPAEVERLLASFVEMKRLRLKKIGAPGAFDQPEVQAFFRRLFADALALYPRPFVLHGLEVAGKLRAVTGSSRAADRMICDFCGIAEDEMMQASPGDFLFFENIRAACDEGIGVFDFSVGDEAYKRHWCDIETAQFDIIVALSARGQVLTAGMRAAARAKRFIKGNERIWSFAKRWRKTAAAPSED
jgi:CelD/BcsL family acetyltransferase involved in cellulose biosynthesis